MEARDRIKGAEMTSALVVDFDLSMDAVPFAETISAAGLPPKATARRADAPHPVEKARLRSGKRAHGEGLPDVEWALL